MSAERLQKVLASAGIASRRDCEEYIAAGRVMVNGKVVRIPGTRVDPEHDEILVDGKPIGKIHHRTYVMLHKPAGVVSTTDDPHGRPTVVDLVNLPQRLFPVGRLDYDSEGLLLLTDDGELTQKLTHPSYQVEKEYQVLLNDAPSPNALRAWRTGVELDGVKTAPAWVELIERTPEGAWVRVILHEGRKRQIREVARLLGYEVRRLIRVREGPLALGDLPSGTWRFLTDEEVDMLREHAERNAAVADAERPRRREQDEMKAVGGRRLRRINPSARLLQKGEKVTETTLPELDEAIGSEKGIPSIGEEGRKVRDKEAPHRNASPARDFRRDDRGSGFRSDRRNDRGSGPRDFRRDDRGNGPRDFRRDDRGNGPRDFRRDDRGNGPRDFRRDDRSSGFRSDRRDDRGSGFRSDRRDDRSSGFRSDRRDDRSSGFRSDRRDDRSSGFRSDRRDDRSSGFRSDRRDDRSSGFRSDRRDDRSSGFRSDRRDDRSSGFRSDRRDDRSSGFRSDRRDDRSSGFRSDRRDDRSSGFRSDRRDNRGARGFSRSDRPPPRYSEDDEE
ncbi:pseudouridine synthase [Roseiflexus castenholzii]|uniref:Pseudouridine synthase n=1 Tax=Roseiflexus castenholzii (strain DSM 13941 / HLO8) TaxID=383372 RepID=A7NF12_ROSCS|nr:pseudouridine synthase [Roseiflexus castenholzii]ABU56300.1 pseudouridine synthase [Roseiflexus castenholzii DSM 13941]